MVLKVLKTAIITDIIVDILWLL